MRERDRERQTVIDILNEEAKKEGQNGILGQGTSTGSTILKLTRIL